MTQHINYTIQTSIAQIEIDRPERRNALALSTIKQIAEAVERATATPEVRVIVLTGAGDRVFSAGADLTEVPDAMNSPDRAQAFDEAFKRASWALQSCPLPTVAKLQGHTIGGGLSLASACDLRIATAKATIGYPVTRIGLMLNVYDLRNLIRLIGVSRAKWILFTGERITAREAATWGLVDRVYDDDVFEAESQRIIAEIAAGAPLSVGVSKLMIDEIGDTGDIAETVLQECYNRIYISADLKEGYQAVQEKRPPVFRGE